MTTLPASPYLERLIRFLIPYFTGVTPDLQAARAEAYETLASYGARTRAELMNAMQVIILGFATLETLGEAKTTEMSPSMRLRFRGCANNLNRNGQKTEQTLLKRLACDVPDATLIHKDPVNDVAEPEAEAALQQTQTRIDSMRNRLSGNRPPHSPQPQAHKHDNKRPSAHSTSANPMQADANKRLWGQAMMDTLSEMGMPVQPAPPATPVPG